MVKINVNKETELWTEEATDKEHRVECSTDLDIDYSN